MSRAGEALAKMREQIPITAPIRDPHTVTAYALVALVELRAERRPTPPDDVDLLARIDRGDVYVGEDGHAYVDRPEDVEAHAQALTARGLAKRIWDSELHDWVWRLSDAGRDLLNRGAA